MINFKEEIFRFLMRYNSKAKMFYTVQVTQHPTNSIQVRSQS